MYLLSKKMGQHYADEWQQKSYQHQINNFTGFSCIGNMLTNNIQFLNFQRILPPEFCSVAMACYMEY